MEIVLGRRYFFRRSRRIDQFRHKRYSSPELDRYQSIVVMGRAIEQRGAEVKVVIEECGMQPPEPRDGETVVLSTGEMLTIEGGDLRTLEEHGKPNVTLGVWQ